MSSGSVVLISVTNDNLANHDARLEGGVAEHLLGHGDQAHAIAPTLLVVVRVLLGNGGLGSDQTLSSRTIDEGGLQQVCNHRVQACVFAGTKHREQHVSGTILAAGDPASLLEAGLETHLIGNDVLHVRHAVVAANDAWPMLASHGVVAVWVHHVQTALRTTDG